MRAMSYSTQSTTPGSSGNSGGTFESTLRQMWATRPVRFPRSQSGRSWFFGVCEGIAVRYQISPLLVRLMFVLLTFVGGIGLWVYGLSLLVFRRYTVPKTPLEVLVHSERDPRYAEDRSLAIGTLVVGAVLLLFSGVLSGGVSLAGVAISVVLTGVVWWLLHERQPVAPAGLLDRDDVTTAPTAAPPEPTAPAAPSEPAASAASAQSQQDAGPAPTIDLGDVSAASGFEPPRREPPEWDPLGTAPFAWDLPDPGYTDADASGSADGAGPKKKRRGLKALLTVIVVGIVAAVVIGGLALANSLFGWSGVTSEDDNGTSGTMTSGTTQVAEVPEHHNYSFTMSNQTLDFTGATVTQDSTVDLNTTMASVGLVFPRTTDGESYRVNLSCDSLTLSEVDCGAFNGTVVRGQDDDRDGDSADPEHTLTVNVNATMSDVSFEQRG